MYNRLLYVLYYFNASYYLTIYWTIKHFLSYKSWLHSSNPVCPILYSSSPHLWGVLLYVCVCLRVSTCVCVCVLSLPAELVYDSDALWCFCFRVPLREDSPSDFTPPPWAHRSVSPSSGLYKQHVVSLLHATLGPTHGLRFACLCLSVLPAFSSWRQDCWQLWGRFYCFSGLTSPSVSVCF